MKLLVFDVVICHQHEATDAFYHLFWFSYRRDKTSGDIKDFTHKSSSLVCDLCDVSQECTALFLIFCPMEWFLKVK